MQYEKVRYPDGTFYARITDFTNPIIKERINSYEDLWFIRQLKDICDHVGVKVSLEIPCLLDAQADRRFNQNESANLRLVCTAINEMHFEHVGVFHPHNPEVVENLIDRCVIIPNHTFISGVLAVLSIPEDQIILFSTDAGGFKPLMKLADAIGWTGEVYSATKSRKFENGKSSLIQQVDRSDFGGKAILIIDDLCVFGGTFVGLANILENKNCGALYLAVSHITVSNPKEELLAYSKIFTTNSKYDRYTLPNIQIHNIL